MGFSPDYLIPHYFVATRETKSAFSSSFCFFTNVATAFKVFRLFAFAGVPKKYHTVVVCLCAGNAA
jgi:hypothetical protein